MTDGNNTFGQPTPGPRGSGARGSSVDWRQHVGRIIAQRSDSDANTLGLGITGLRRITGAAQAEACRCRWWTLTVTAVTDAGIGGTNVPTEQSVMTAGVRHSPLQVVLQFSDGSGIEQRIPLDIGPGFVVRFYGSAPQVYLALDQGVFVVTAAGGPSPIPAGSLITSYVYASLECTECYGPTDWQVTAIHSILAEATTSIFVPPRAKTVQIWQGDSGPPPTVAYMLQWGGGTAGVYEFSGRSGPRVRIPGTVRILRIPLIFNATRIMSAVFEVQL